MVETIIKDPDTGGDISISIYKHHNGGMFGVDSSYLEQTTDVDNYPVVLDVFNRGGNVMLMD